jgi:hypothetical protein
VEKEKQMDIKTDPKVEVDAKARFKALQSQLEAEKNAQLHAAQEASEQQTRAEQLDAIKRNTFAQEQRAIADKRLAESLENQNQIGNRPITPMPPEVTSPLSVQAVASQPPAKITEPLKPDLTNGLPVKKTEPKDKDHPL